MVTKTINGKTTLLAIYGDPIGHSLSPLMHNAAFHALGRNCVYIPCHVRQAELSNAVKAIRALNFHGVNITIPHKQAVMNELDEIFGDSLKSGSVNTIINRNGKLCGTSTDGIGLVTSLRKEANFEPSGKSVLILGAGGSARAVIYSLIATGIKSLMLVNRDFLKTVDLQVKIWRDTGFEIQVHELNNLAELDWTSFDLVINTTPAGLNEELSLVPADLLRPQLLIYDLIYKKGGTKLYQDALDAGCRVLSGLSLLLYQGIESFKLWFEEEPPVSVMREAIQQYINQ